LRRYIQHIKQEKKRREIFHFSTLFKTWKMSKVVKQVVGIDVAQNELVVCLGRMMDSWKSELYARKTFLNNQSGFKALVEWVQKLTDTAVPVRYVMEATGVYHESLAYFLFAQGLELSVVLPTKIASYARSLTVKTVTDKTGQFGLERTLENWEPPKPLFKKMRDLTRERDQLTSESVVLKNQLHAEAAQASPNKKSIERTKKRMALIHKQLAEILEELKELIGEDKEVKELLALLGTIVGVGFLTAATVVAETEGFNMIRNKRQLTSYAGLDVREKQSGTSVKGKPSISKRGNKYLRKAMYMPGLAAIRHDERLKAVYARLLSKHGIKMKAAVAVQRKVLEMMFTVYKTGKAYDRNYLQQAA
jgi:transposase